ncbi:MAG: enoyl-CoA hydratase-related protein [Actinomycetota bacterium]
MRWCGTASEAPFVPLGVVPEAAGRLLMPAIMGNQRAAVALYTDEWVSAADAVAAGLAVRAVPADQVVAARRDAVRGARAHEDARTRGREDATFARMVGTADHRDALTSFLGRD